MSPTAGNGYADNSFNSGFFSLLNFSVVSLAHASIARGHFLRSHEIFTGARDGNHFYHMGDLISGIILRHFLAEDIWL